MNNIVIKRICANQYGARKWFEVRIQCDDRIRTIDLDLEEMKKLGVTKSLNGTKKLREWLLSDNGYNYIKHK